MTPASDAAVAQAFMELRDSGNTYANSICKWVDSRAQDIDRARELDAAARTGVDANVEAVRAKLLARSQVGIAKYGVTTERPDLSLGDWLGHLQEELMDAAIYIQAARAAIAAATDGGEG